MKSEKFHRAEMDNPPLPAVWHLGISGLSISSLIFNTQFLFDSLRFMGASLKSQVSVPRLANIVAPSQAKLGL